MVGGEASFGLFPVSNRFNCFFLNLRVCLVFANGWFEMMDSPRCPLNNINLLAEYRLVSGVFICK